MGKSWEEREEALALAMGFGYNEAIKARVGRQ